MDFKKTSRKYPIGKNNKQCIGPCYPIGHYAIHPITLKPISNKEHPFCPTEQWFDESNNQVQYTDVCFVPTKEKDLPKNLADLNLILPSFHFNHEFFLKAYYNIDSFEKALEYIQINSNLSIYTRLRIMECAWKLYGDKIDIFDEQLIDFYIEVIKKDWIWDIYPKIENYIYVDKDNKIYLKKIKSNENENEIKKYTNEKINYFFEKFITKQKIYNILQNFIKENKKKWRDINSFNLLIEQYLIEYIIKQINSTI